jgi:8-oxo-dGTP diphosphatase
MAKITTRRERGGSEQDPAVYPRPSVAVDLVVASVSAEGALVVLLLKRKERPFAGRWALPGGFVHQGESVGMAAARVLREKTGLDDVELDELRTFSEPDRDPRAWVISVAHLALVPADRLSDVKPGRAAEDAQFCLLAPRDEPPGFTLRTAAGAVIEGPLGFDHDSILAHGLSRLRHRVTTTPLAFGLLPRRFTLSEAQRIVEAILGRKLDKAAFRTKILSLGLVRPTEEEKRGGAHRPAKLYVAAKGWDVAR